MSMLENANRTFVCSVLFLDIVEYSKRSVTDQPGFVPQGDLLRGVARLAVSALGDNASHAVNVGRS